MSVLRILGLDTSGKNASVALLDTEQDILLGEHTVYTSRTHSQVILPLCKELLEECRLTMEDVECLAVSVGPGSYTGLRIGIAAVQGMAMARNLPCAGVSALEAMAARLVYAPLIVSLMYARADLYYCALFSNAANQFVRLTEDAMLSYDEICGLLSAYPHKPLLVGDGAERFRQQYRDCEIAPAPLRLQSAAGVCLRAAEMPHGTAEELTASYLQAVQIQKKKSER